MKLKIVVFAVAACLAGMPAAMAQEGDWPDQDPIYEPFDEPVDVPDYDEPVDVPDYGDPIEIPDDDEPTDPPEGDPIPDGPYF